MDQAPAAIALLDSIEGEFAGEDAGKVELIRQSVHMQQHQRQAELARAATDQEQKLIRARKLELQSRLADALRRGNDQKATEIEQQLQGL